MKGNLQFSPLRDRWCFTNDKVEYHLHCGEAVEIRVGDTYYGARIELCGEGWYAIFHEDAKRCDAFVLMRNRTYAARWIYT
ncbi:MULTISPECIES: DUF5348 domain-containing protein [Alicyclobacillus]|uniref:DUF5348 domain-containing protein n=1 Tax=Alicyclobacillus TaxID=29330 RepID=UPI000385468F|nr:hypothetical protein N007_18610 [Alicyclobacillus acidoterrestris ATCC 49025]